MYMYILHKNFHKIFKNFRNIKFLLYRNYHLWPSTKGVYPVQLMGKDHMDFHQQTFMQNGINKNHFSDYEDTHSKHRTQRDDISTGLAP